MEFEKKRNLIIYLVWFIIMSGLFLFVTWNSLSNKTDWDVSSDLLYPSFANFLTCLGMAMLIYILFMLWKRTLLIYPILYLIFATVLIVPISVRNLIYDTNKTSIFPKKKTKEQVFREYFHKNMSDIYSKEEIDFACDCIIIKLKAKYSKEELKEPWTEKMFEKLDRWREDCLPAPRPKS
jgi:glucan phosphoethanolaminetransferase (alkaline phosphatase superfamily)